VATESGDYKTAVDYYEHIIRCATTQPQTLSDTKKDLARAYGMLARSMLGATTDLNLVLKHLDAAIEADPNIPGVRMLKADVLITRGENLLDLRRQRLLEGDPIAAEELLLSASAAYGKVLEQMRVVDAMQGVSPAARNYLGARMLTLENRLLVQARGPRPSVNSISEIPPGSFFGRIRFNARKAWNSLRSAVVDHGFWGGILDWIRRFWLKIFLGVPLPLILGFLLDRRMRDRDIFEDRLLLGIRMGNAAYTILLVALGVSLRVPGDLILFLVLCGLPSAAYAIHARYFYHSPSECPSCGSRVSDYEDYDDLDFSRCPSCGHHLESPLTLAGYIQHIATELDAVLVGRSGSNSDRGGPASQRERMRLFIFLLVTHAFRSRATDIHIELDQATGDSREARLRCRVRLRIDGILFYDCNFSDLIHQHLVAAVKNMAKMDVADRLHPQDGHLSMTIEGVPLQIRASTSPTSTGEKLVLRLLDKRQVSRPPDTLGFQPVPYMELENAIHAPNGIVLAVGPTGSGKTTLLYSALCTLLDGEKSVVSVEDPIEYDIPGINQVEHDPKVGVTFSNALRNILRQDPDIIMVGEIRDRETLQMTVEAAKTGHLVFSTLHTIDSWTAIMRLVDMGASTQDISETLRAVVALRLVRKICPRCKEEIEPTSAERELLDRASSVKGRPNVWIGKGCEACQNTGYLGRTGLFEVLILNEELRDMVAAGVSMAELRRTSIAAGMVSLWEDGMQKVAEGITTIEEVMRSCRRPDEAVQKTT
jgi:type II secretory ATPase GspE/PulE/Tfp pilus assembly ATPase PilB-like protein